MGSSTLRQKCSYYGDGVVQKCNWAHVCSSGMKKPKTVAMEQKSSQGRNSHRSDLRRHQKKSGLGLLLAS